MNLFKKFGKVILVLFVAYFLAFLVIGSIMRVDSGMNPPSSEFSGLGFYLLFFPFFELLGFFGMNSLFYLLLPFGFILTYIALVYVFKTSKKTAFIMIGVFFALIIALNLFASYNPANKVTSLEGIEELGLQSARDGNISLCKDKIAEEQVSSRETCYHIAASFSGNEEFCQLSRDQNYCSYNVKTANNLVNKVCINGESRIDCLLKTCFPDGLSGEVVDNFVYCIWGKATEFNDKTWCNLISEGTTTLYEGQGTNTYYFDLCNE